MDACLGLLGQPSDEAKFAGLLLATRLLDTATYGPASGTTAPAGGSSGNHDPPQDRRPSEESLLRPEEGDLAAIYTAMGSMFLTRLLLARPEDSGFTNETAVMSASLGVSVISTLASSRSLIAATDLVSANVDALVGLLLQATTWAPSVGVADQLFHDICDAVLRVAETRIGAIKLLAHGQALVQDLAWVCAAIDQCRREGGDGAEGNDVSGGDAKPDRDTPDGEAAGPSQQTAATSDGDGVVEDVEDMMDEDLDAGQDLETDGNWMDNAMMPQSGGLDFSLRRQLAEQRRGDGNGSQPATGPGAGRRFSKAALARIDHVFHVARALLQDGAGGELSSGDDDDDNGALVARAEAGVCVAFAAMSEVLVASTGMEKFFALSVMSLAADAWHLDESVSQVLPRIRPGLADVLRSHLPARMRREAFHLVHCLFARFGSGWIAERVSDQHDGASRAGGTLLELICQVVRVDLRVAFESEKLGSDDVRLVVAAATLLEDVIAILVGDVLDGTVSGDLDPEAILRVGEAIRESMQAVLFYLTSLAAGETISGDLELTATRLLGAWLAEESDALVDDVCDLLPWLVAAPSAPGGPSPGRLSTLGNLDLAAVVDLLSLPRLSATALLSAGREPATRPPLAQTLPFLLPGLVTLTADPGRGREAVVETRADVLLAAVVLAGCEASLAGATAVVGSIGGDVAVAVSVLLNVYAAPGAEARVAGLVLDRLGVVAAASASLLREAEAAARQADSAAVAGRHSFAGLNLAALALVGGAAGASAALPDSFVGSLCDTLTSSLPTTRPHVRAWLRIAELWILCVDLLGRVCAADRDVAALVRASNLGSVATVRLADGAFPVADLEVVDAARVALDMLLPFLA